ncbi:MAG: hypothetical protein AB1665_07215 [Candidatus Thermoplasmatota archaeon]
MARASWREKLEKRQEHEIVVVGEKWAGRFGFKKGERCLIPRPLDVDALIRKVGAGKLVTPRIIRERLARDFKVEGTCPLTTGIFINISARAAEEDRASGRKDIAPYWRVVKDDGGLNPKFPGGIKGHAKLLREEGHTILRGKVKGFESCLERL